MKMYLMLFAANQPKIINLESLGGPGGSNSHWKMCGTKPHLFQWVSGPLGPPKAPLIDDSGVVAANNMT